MNMPCCVALKSLDTLAFLGFFFGIVSFLITFNVKQMPWLPYPLVGNLQDVDKNYLPNHWEQGAVLIVLLWGVSYLRKSVLVILKQKYLLNVTELKTSGTNPKNNKQQKKRYHTHSINNNVDISVISSTDTTNFGQIDGLGQQTHPRQKIKHLEHSSQENVHNYVAPTFIFHTFFGVWTGWACNTHENVQYRSSDEEWLATGILIWLVSEVAIIIRTVVSYRKGNFFDRR